MIRSPFRATGSNRGRDALASHLVVVVVVKVAVARPWLLKWSLWMLPAPWLAAELGWFVAEYGRQPWTIYGVLPTHLSVSTLNAGSVIGSLAGFIGFYTMLLVVEMYLMVKYARLGPASLGTGRYAGEAGPHGALQAG